MNQTEQKLLINMSPQENGSGDMQCYYVINEFFAFYENLFLLCLVRSWQTVSVDSSSTFYGF